MFVGGLPLHVDKDGLKDFFSVFGPVTDAIVMMDMMAHRSRGFGFITFENGKSVYISSFILFFFHNSKNHLMHVQVAMVPKRPLKLNRSICLEKW